MSGYSSDYGSSRDYDFSSSKKTTGKSARDYAKDDKREYKTPNKGLSSPVGMNLNTESIFSAILLLDQTGSMGDSPKYMIEKMPTLYSESNAAIQGKKLSELAKGETLEDKLEIAIIAIGDERNREQYPLQATNYAKGADLVKNALSIYPEGNGGGNGKESYDLGLYFALNHVTIPNNGIKPLLIIVGDEGFYETIRASEVKKHMGDSLTEDIKTEKVIKDLVSKFDTYMLRPEIGDYDSGTYSRIQRQWEEVLGREKVLKMQGEYKRLVDCVIGICGFAADNFEEAEAMLKRRQTPGQVSEVLATLHPLLSSKGSSNSAKKRK